ncbi:MAG TPA: YciI family protein [Alphaproteobacteria bacterium]|nr:YciI family protein [Alphaproteobacteria bacterium]
MLFAITCLDKPGHGALRQETRPSHLAYLKSFHEQLVLAGPLLSEDGKAPCGSLLVLDFPDRRSAEAFADGDPYTQAGLFADVSIRPFRRVLP